jgi:hypothetical protein
MSEAIDRGSSNGSIFGHTFFKNIDWMNITVMADLPTPPEPITTNLISVGIVYQVFFEIQQHYDVSNTFIMIAPEEG